MTLKHVLRLGLLLASTAISGSALAQDHWNGFYLGANAGYASLDVENTFFASATNDTDVSGGLFGAQAGFNHRIEQIVLGLEGDVAFSSADGSGPLFVGGGCCVQNFDLGTLVTLRVRAGMAFGAEDRTLAFLTAGVAFAEAKNSGYMLPKDTSHTGLVVGAGLEHMLSDVISIKAEYQYVALNKKSLGVGEAVKPSGSLFKVGVNFHF